jgi:hypothetical protein
MFFTSIRIVAEASVNHFRGSSHRHHLVFSIDVRSSQSERRTSGHAIRCGYDCLLYIFSLSSGPRPKRYRSDVGSNCNPAICCFLIPYHDNVGVDPLAEANMYKTSGKIGKSDNSVASRLASMNFIRRMCRSAAGYPDIHFIST